MAFSTSLAPVVAGLTFLLAGCAGVPNSVLLTAAGIVLTGAGVPDIVGSPTAGGGPGSPGGPIALPGDPSSLPGAPGGATAGDPPSDGELARALAAANRERATAGAKPLAWSDGLAQVALKHSQDMVARDFFDHTNPDGLSPFDRMKAAGIRYGAAAENIAMNHSPDGEQVITQWMNSPGHRANLLSGSYGHMGLGVAKAASGARYWTQVFTN